VGALAVSVVFALWLALRIGGSSAVRDFDDVVTALAALGAALACLFAARRQDGAGRRFWALLGAALCAWTLAEVIWAVYDVILRVAVPVPSWADVGYLCAIPLAAAALLSHPAMHSSGRPKARATLDGLAMGTAVLLLSWTFVLGPLWRHTDLSTAGGIVALAYPFGDLVLIFLVLLSIRSMTRTGRYGLLWVLAGLSAMAVSDSTYAYLVEVGRYSTGNLVDVGWVVAYLAIGVGAVRDKGGTLTVWYYERAQDSVVSLVTPYVPVLLALSALTLEVELHHRLDRVSWLLGFGLALLTIARQSLLLVDRRHERVAESLDHLSSALIVPLDDPLKAADRTAPVGRP
jgi:hypothetical protein